MSRIIVLKRNNSGTVKSQKLAKFVGAKRHTKKTAVIGGFYFIGGVDGTRTRDPRRDRPVF